MLQRREFPADEYSHSRGQGYAIAARQLLSQVRTVDEVLDDVEDWPKGHSHRQGVEMAVSDWMATRQYYMDVGASKLIEPIEGVF